MEALEKVRAVLGGVLSLGDRTALLQPDTQLLGGIPEFDSMAVVTVIGALEDEFGIVVDDDELTADVFATVGSLVDFVQIKTSA
jgi:acyl carrier protein